MSECRFCKTELTVSFCDLGMSPLSNSYLKKENLDRMEPFYPLHAYVCEKCLLVQLEEFESPENIFSDYAYFSSYSDSWLKHCEDYVSKMTERFGLNESSHVVEVASNDGYLLQFFKDRGVPITGVEPAANVAKVAQEKGIPTEVRFFGLDTAKYLVEEKGIKADLALGNNVLAHVPDINDFVSGYKHLIKDTGVITFEFPHLMRLMESVQFDTIYHEHFSYLSLYSVEKIFAAHGLKVFDVEQVPTHGGSLRVFAGHDTNTEQVESDHLKELRSAEESFGLHSIEAYKNFEEIVQAKKREVLKFLIDCKESGKTVVGYGAPAKGNTLLNYCGVRQDMVSYTVDRSPHKQDHYLPGTHIPIRSPEAILNSKPDYVFILPWNLKDEISDQMKDIRNWGGQFVTAIPTLEVF